MPLVRTCASKFALTDHLSQRDEIVAVRSVAVDEYHQPGWPIAGERCEAWAVEQFGSFQGFAAGTKVRPYRSLYAIPRSRSRHRPRPSCSSTPERQRGVDWRNGAWLVTCCASNQFRTCCSCSEIARGPPFVKNPGAVLSTSLLQRESSCRPDAQITTDRTSRLISTSEPFNWRQRFLNYRKFRAFTLISSRGSGGM